MKSLNVCVAGEEVKLQKNHLNKATNSLHNCPQLVLSLVHTNNFSYFFAVYPEMFAGLIFERPACKPQPTEQRWPPMISRSPCRCRLDSQQGTLDVTLVWISHLYNLLMIRWLQLLKLEFLMWHPYFSLVWRRRKYNEDNKSVVSNK